MLYNYISYIVVTKCHKNITKNRLIVKSIDERIKPLKSQNQLICGKIKSYLLDKIQNMHK
jgi:hypothetical protein